MTGSKDYYEHMLFNKDYNVTIQRYIGLSIQDANTKAPHLAALVANHKFHFPCGWAFEVVAVPGAPTKDVLCPCGDPSHIWIEASKEIAQSGDKRKL